MNGWTNFISHERPTPWDDKFGATLCSFISSSLTSAIKLCKLNRMKEMKNCVCTYIFALCKLSNSLIQLRKLEWRNVPIGSSLWSNIICWRYLGIDVLQVTSFWHGRLAGWSFHGWTISFRRKDPPPGIDKYAWHHVDSSISTSLTSAIKFYKLPE